METNSGKAETRKAKKVRQARRDTLSSIEYENWRNCEVVLPIVAGPLLIFLFLGVVTVGRGLSLGWASLLSGVAGSGDLLVFAAFLTINVGAKYNFVEDGERRTDIIRGESRSINIILIGSVFLAAYMGTRVAVEVASNDNVNKLKYFISISSMIVLMLTFMWLDSLMRKMQMKLIKRDLQKKIIQAYYNR